MADPYLYTVMSWAGYVGVDLSPWPALARYQARMEARPGVAATLAAEREAKKT